MDKSTSKLSRVWTAVTVIALVSGFPTAQCKERSPDTASVESAGAFLAGQYENSAQVAQDRAKHPPSQHVTITIEPTPQADWELWRVHMDVDPEVAESAGSDTSLDAVWAMKFSRNPRSKALQLIPYAPRPSVDIATLSASAFDESQWLSLEACVLEGDFGTSRITLQVPPDEMCVAVTMGLGGKRAFLPTSVEREGEWLRVQLIYFGRPWRVDAHRLTPAPNG